MSKEGFFYDKSGHKIIYNHLELGTNYLVFLGGLMSDRKGSKALFFEDYARKNNYSYIRFDYLGHGDSDLAFTDCNIDIWLDNVLEILVKLTKDYQVNLLGSSLGGWLALLAAQKMPDKIAKILTIAAAPDFTEELIWSQLDQASRAKLLAGQIYNLSGCDDIDSYYPITIDLINSGRNNLLLANEQPLALTMPITLIHGMKDIDVSYEYSVRLVNKLIDNPLYSPKLILLKQGDHRLSDQNSLAAMAHELDLLLAL
jgi:pimeloyl-ACP methyl ester carboxylesterase